MALGQDVLLLGEGGSLNTAGGREGKDWLYE